MPQYNLVVNGQPRRIDTGDDTEIGILYYLRDVLGITGPKYGCGVDVCKACTCHVNGQASTTCTTSFEDALATAGPDGVIEITTIEGLAGQDGSLHPVQQAWLEMDVAQCGFCQPGQIMQAVKVIEAAPGGRVDDDDIDAIENVCRCGTYCRIREAIKSAADRMRPGGQPDGVPPVPAGNR
jgi:isoquinoline 1-oxidoreductase alpha subunit